MQHPAMIPSLFGALAVALWSWYGWVVYRMAVGVSGPRRSEAWALIALGSIVVMTATVRFATARTLLPSLHIDEAQNLAPAYAGTSTTDVTVFSGEASPFTSGGAMYPLLIYAPMQVPVRWLLSDWWAIRLWPIVCGVLSIVGVYGVTRALGLGTMPGLFAALCLAVLPWSTAYGLTSMGGELVWHECVLLWAMAIALSGAPLRFSVLASGGLALIALLYDYFVGRTAVWMVLFLAPALGRRVWVAAVILGVAAAAWYPAWNASAAAQLGLVSGAESEMPSWTRIAEVGRLFVDGAAPTLGASMGLAHAANMPGVLLALAVVGWLTATWRQKWFLMAVFVAGIAPAIVSALPTSHRLLLSFVVFPIAASVAVESPRWVLVATIAVWLAIAGALAVADPSFWSSDGWGYTLPSA